MANVNPNQFNQDVFVDYDIDEFPFDPLTDDSFDHTLIYEEGTLSDVTVAVLRSEGFSLTPVPFRPTAENLARHFCEVLTTQELPVSTVTVYETPENCAVYEVEK